MAGSECAVVAKSPQSGRVPSCWQSVSAVNGPVSFASQDDIAQFGYCATLMHIVSSVGIRELRQQASAVLRRVVAGEVIDITEHGRPIARIVPLRHTALEQMVIDGRATAPESDLLKALVELSLPATSTGSSPSSALAELRNDER
jgi:prevent-host-death family protein